jgi:Holliday junction resolvase RusA-like endonuclease
MWGSGRPVVIDDNKAELWAWRDLVALYARRAMRGQEPIDRACEVTITMYLAKPPTNRDPYPIRRKDADKLQRAVFDALVQGRVLVDDGRVTDAHVKKRFADSEHPEGAEIMVEELEIG